MDHTIVLPLLALVALGFAADINLGLNTGRKIYDQKIEASPALWRQTQNITVSTNDSEVISHVVVTDLRPYKDGDAKIVEGGEGQQNVTVELKSPTVLRGYDFRIEVYAAPEESMVKGQNHGFGHPRVVGQVKPDGNAKPVHPDITKPSINLDNTKLPESSTKKDLPESEFPAKVSTATVKGKDSSTSKLNPSFPGQDFTTAKNIQITSDDKATILPSHPLNSDIHTMEEKNLKTNQDSRHVRDTQEIKTEKGQAHINDKNVKANIPNTQVHLESTNQKDSKDVTHSFVPLHNAKGVQHDIQKPDHEHNGDFSADDAFIREMMGDVVHPTFTAKDATTHKAIDSKISTTEITGVKNASVGTGHDLKSNPQTPMQGHVPFIPGHKAGPSPYPGLKLSEDATTYKALDAKISTTEKPRPARDTSVGTTEKNEVKNAPVGTGHDLKSNPQTPEIQGHVPFTPGHNAGPSPYPGLKLSSTVAPNTSTTGRIINKKPTNVESDESDEDFGQYQFTSHGGQVKGAPRPLSNVHASKNTEEKKPVISIH